MSTSEIRELQNLLSQLEKALDDVPAIEIDNELVQKGLTLFTKLYFNKRDLGSAFLPFDESSDISSTAVMVTTSAMLKAARLNVFELSLWNNMSSSRY